MNGHSTKNLLLDLGGVLYDLDFQKSIDAFEKLGINDFQAVYSHAQQTQLFDLFERGEVSVENFRNEIRRMSAKQIPSAEIDAAWNALLIGIPERRIKLIEQLSKKYNLFLLSNTNELHLNAVELYIEKTYGIKRFENCFKKIYYSNKMGKKKPDADCFEFVLGNADISKAETIFIDDTIRHIDGAIKCGINAIHLNLEKNDIHSLLDSLEI